MRDGNDSCYGEPSFQVFLRRGAGFRPSPGFTELAHQYCGMFEIDAPQRRLRTISKSRNGAYRYVIHDSSDRLGVSVYRRGHETFLPGKPATRVGTLAGLPVKDLDNVRAASRPAE